MLLLSLRFYISLLPFLFLPKNSDALKHDRFLVPRKLVHSDSCKGLLPWTCVCTPDVVDDTNGPNSVRVDTISCLSSRLTHSEILSNALQTFQNAQSATFYGNNFFDLPERFSGIGQHKKLLYLNLTGNHIQRLHHDSFLGLPSLQSLDLSENSIHLRHEYGDWTFLRPVRFLRRLLLRHAFRRQVENENGQLHLLEQGLRHAHLRDLQFLDLTDNGFTQFPHKLICWTPALTHLILAHNRFRTLRFDDRCVFSELKVIDLRGNRFVHFNFLFSKSSNRLPPMSIQISGNPLDCSSKSCASWHSMMWFRATAVIRDKELVRCHSQENGDQEGYQFDNYMLYAPLDNHLECATFETTSHNTVAPKGKGTISNKNQAIPTKVIDNVEVETTDDDQMMKNLTSPANSTASTAVFMRHKCDRVQSWVYYLALVVPAFVIRLRL